MLIDCHTHVGAEIGQYFGNGFPYGQHLVELVRDGGSYGVDRWMVFPMVTHLGLNLAELRKGNMTAEGAMESVPYAWENHRLMEEIYDLFPAEGKSALPLAMFDPLRNPVEQVKALRKLQEQYKFYALKTQTTMIQAPIKSLLKEGRVILDFAEEFDFGLLIHSSVLPADTWAQANDIIDIVEQFPQIRFCVAHSCRFDRLCLDRIAALPNCWYDCSAHGIHCVLATQDSPVVAPPERRFDSDYTRPGQVLRDMAAVYGDKLMWGSDAPYYSFAAKVMDDMLALISTYKDEVDYFNELDEADRERVGYANTMAFLGLDSLD